MKRTQNEKIYISSQTGWVRVFLSPEENYSTLVYVTDESTIAGIVEKIDLRNIYTIWVQFYGGIKTYRLKNTEKPLKVQDDFLKYLGYNDDCRRARLGTDPLLANIIKFVIGPASDVGVNSCGYVYILKGLVLPQWKKRLGVIIADKFFLYAQNGSQTSSDYDVIPLSGASLKLENDYKLNKHVIRVVTCKQLFFGFENLWERNIWKKWIEKATTTELTYRKLDLSDCGLEKIPKTVISTWVDLEELNLSENQLDIEDATVQVLLESPKLRKLSLSSTCLSSLPSYVHELRKLEYLNVSKNFITDLPETIVQLSNLTDLILDYNEICDLPMLDDLRKLRTLSAAHNNLGNECSLISKGMRQINNEQNDGKNQFVLKSNLSAVNLRGNSLKGFIKLANYGNLTDLDLCENNIEQLDLSSLANLKCIKCSKNQLTDLTLNGTELISCVASNNKLRSLTIISHPTLLQHLDVSCNELKVLPDWVSKCNVLKTLVASHNRLTELPQDIFCNEDSALDTLVLSFNQLTVLPQTMRRMPIQCLYLQNNSLITLPRHFFVASSSLRTLNVSKNCLKELPQFISKNEKLEYLFLTSNALTDITPLLNCTRLKTLHIAYNAISSLPEGCVSAWPSIVELVISGNSLSQIPENVNTWHSLKIFRAHSNLFVSTPSFVKNRSLKILDLSNNYLEKIDLVSLVPKQLLYLDLSANTHLHVDSKQFYQYKNHRSLDLVDVSGHNRNSLPFHPSSSDESKGYEFYLPWLLGFSETVGKSDKLYISQLRLPEFCNSEALLGIFDSVDRPELSKQFVKIAPRIMLEERSVKETSADYMKYTMLATHRELKDYSSQSEIYCTLCHISKQKESSGNTQTRKYILRIASVGNTTSILCRDNGSLTLSHSAKQTYQKRAFTDITRNKFVADPHVTEIALHDQDQFLLLANQSLWDVISIEEAVAEVRSVLNPGLAAKRLQDLAQSYGCENNLSIIVLRFHDFQSDSKMLNRNLKFTMRSNKIHINNEFCECDEDNLIHAQPAIAGSNRSSPSGQSDKGNNFRYNRSFDGSDRNNYSYRKYSQPLPLKESLANQTECTFSGSLADAEESYSDKSALHVSEERFRCWEYMLEQNTQMLFDKELDTLSRNFTKRTVPSRPELWSPHTKSVSHLPDCIQSAPFLNKRFGSARSYNGASRLDMNRRSLNGGPNAAYFGSLQRLMPYHLEYNFSEIKEKFDNNMDSLELDGRMHKYWDVATTEL